jgi:RimJ/RimL family protein N-acetyltransferase/dihydrofolate reductase
MQAPDIFTDRLSLTPLTVRDAEALFSYRSRPEVCQYQSWEPSRLDDAVGFIESLESVEFDSPGTWFQFAIRLRDSAKLIGDLGVHFAEDGHQAEIGFTLDPDSQGCGYGTEAVAGVLDYLFVQLRKHRVSASVDPRNQPSLRLLRRVGMRQEAHLRQSLRFKGAWADDMVFAVLASEWDGLRAGGSTIATSAGADGEALGKVVWSATMSLDGFIAGPGDAMDWVFAYPGPNPVVDEIIRTTGAVLAGRRSYDVGRRSERPETREAFGGAWTGPQFVLTHRPHQADPANIFLTGDIREAVGVALAAAAAGKNLNIIGADVARQCIAAGLIDEIVILLAPVLLGDGVRLFAGQGEKPIELETMSVTRSGQVTNLRFRVVKSGS